MPLRVPFAIRVRSLVALAALAAACTPRDDGATVRFWALGHEGDAVARLVLDFERSHPGVSVRVQQIPWSAAHEKLLTAFVGDSMPDVFQLGTTWIPEFQALGALEALDAYVARSPAVTPDAYFAGVWDANAIDGALVALPWYVDTRLLFYRSDLLAAAGVAAPPRTWAEWSATLERVKRNLGPDRRAIFVPLSEWEVPVVLALSQDAELLRDGDRYGNFRSDAFRTAFAFYLDLFERGYAARAGAGATRERLPRFRGGLVLLLSLGSLEPRRVRDAAAAGARRCVGHGAAAGSRCATSRCVDCRRRLARDLEALAAQASGVAARSSGSRIPRARSSSTARRATCRRAARRGRTRCSRAMRARRHFAPSSSTCVRCRRCPSGSASPRRSRAAPRPRCAARSRPRPRWPRSTRTWTRSSRNAVRCSRAPGGTPNRMAMRRRTNPAWLFVAPALGAIALFLFVPVFASLLLSFTDFDIYAVAELRNLRFVGLANYQTLLTEPLFWQALRNTLYFVAVGGPLSVAASLAAALLVNARLARCRPLFRTAFFLPVVTTLVAIAVVWRYLYHPRIGLINQVLSAFGVAPIDWLGDPRWAMPAIILMSVWKNFGFNMIIFVAGLQAIPERLYEAARLDGAGPWRQFRYVTLPMLAPTALFVAVMTMIGGFQLFAEPYVMTQGGPSNRTLSVVLLMFQEGFRFWNMGYAAAIAFVLFAILLAGTALQLKLRPLGGGPS